MPTERELTDEEREELQEAASGALEQLEIEGDGLEGLVAALEAHIVAARQVPRRDEDAIFGLGALFGGLLEGALGWELVELTWDEGLVAVAAVELDRSLVILPFHAVDALFGRPGQEPVLASTLTRLTSGERPPGLARDGYAVLLP